MTYDLRRLRLHDLTERIPKSREGIAQRNLLHPLYHRSIRTGFFHHLAGHSQSKTADGQIHQGRRNRRQQPD